jgi:hypothetical protein
MRTIGPPDRGQVHNGIDVTEQAQARIELEKAFEEIK